MPAAHDRGVDAIREFWTRGRELLNVKPIRHGKHANAAAKQAQRLGCSINDISKMRRVAEQYDGRQIEQICELVILHGARFSAAHFRSLLAVRDRSARDCLTEQAIAGNWSKRELQRAIQSRRDAPVRRGRKPPRPPKNERQKHLEFAKRLESLIEWCKAAGLDAEARTLRAAGKRNCVSIEMPEYTLKNESRVVTSLETYSLNYSN